MKLLLTSSQCRWMDRGFLCRNLRAGSGGDKMGGGIFDPVFRCLQRGPSLRQKWVYQRGCSLDGDHRFEELVLSRHRINLWRLRDDDPPLATCPLPQPNARKMMHKKKTGVFPVPPAFLCMASPRHPSWQEGPADFSCFQRRCDQASDTLVVFHWIIKNLHELGR